MDKSLIRSAPSREPRFTTLETVREYAQERLEDSGEMADARQRHALYCLALAETAKPGLRGPRPVAWLDRLEAEHDNLRAALDGCLNQGDVELAVRPVPPGPRAMTCPWPALSKPPCASSPTLSCHASDDC